MNLDKAGKAQVLELAKRGDLTQAEIGKRVGIGQGRVSQILTEAGWPGRYRRTKLAAPRPRPPGKTRRVGFRVEPELEEALIAQAASFDRTLGQEMRLAAQHWLDWGHIWWSPYNAERPGDKKSPGAPVHSTEDVQHGKPASG